MSWTLDGRPIHRVLVTRLRYLGDIAMSTVVLEVLRRGDPDLEIGYLCEEAFAPLLAGHPALNRLHLLRSPRGSRDARARPRTAIAGDRGSGELGCAADLRRARYDLAVDLFFNPRSAWLLWLAGIARRIGGTAGSRRHLYTHVALAPPPQAGASFVDIAPGGLGDHLARLAPLRHGAGNLPFLTWLEAELAPGELRPRVNLPTLVGTQAARAIDALGAQPGRYTLFAPAATWPAKEWPAAHWRDLAARVTGAGDEPVLVLCPPRGPNSYAALGGAIPAGRGGFLPPLPLAEALRVVGGATRLVSVDGGIMHAGVAMGVPTLALFGPTDPRLWFPYAGLGPYRVLATHPPCSPCDRHECAAFACLPDLDPAMVAAALTTLPRRAGGS